jgi:hypothetical protein
MNEPMITRSRALLERPFKRLTGRNQETFHRWERFAALGGRISRALSTLRNEIFPENLLPPTEAVLQEDEFRHVLVPTADVTTKASVLELRRRIYRIVDKEKKLITGATQVERQIWLVAVAAMTTLLLFEFVAVVVTFIKLVNWFSGSPKGVNAFEQVTRAWSGAGGSDRWFVPISFVALAFVAVRAARGAAHWAANSWTSREIATADQIRPLIRVAINDFANTQNPHRLMVESAPGLSEIGEPDRLVQRSHFRAIEALTERLGVNAIAISGTRGAGKTTLLRQIGGPNANDNGESSLRLMVAAPVTYDPRDFLIHLYLRLCSAVISANGNRRHARPAVRLSISALRYLIRLGVLLVSLPLASAMIPGVHELLSNAGLPVPKSWFVILLYLVGLAVIYGLTERLSVKSGSASSVAIVARAEAERRRLSYLRTVSAELSGAINRWGIQFGRRSTNQLAEQPVSLPDLVESYRDFVVAVTTWLRRQSGRHGRLIVGIDEIDRIADPDDAERFLNSIKPIFGIYGCTYFVTVSEEALARFERRLVRARTAVESAFDEVVRLEAFSFAESLELLRRRVLGFPDAFTALAHCISGGVPRDLVRSARGIVTVRAQSMKSELTDLVPLVLHAEIATLKRGLSDRLDRKDEMNLNRLRILLTDPSWPPCPSEPTWWWDQRSPLTSAVSELVALAKSDSDASVLSKELTSALYFYATVHDVFIPLHSGGKELTQESVRASAGVINEVAKIREVLSVSATLSRQRLDELRMSAGLPMFWPELNDEQQLGAVVLSRIIKFARSVFG